MNFDNYTSISVILGALSNCDKIGLNSEQDYFLSVVHCLLSLYRNRFSLIFKVAMPPPNILSKQVIDLFAVCRFFA